MNSLFSNYSQIAHVMTIDNLNKSKMVLVMLPVMLKNVCTIWDHVVIFLKILNVLVVAVMMSLVMGNDSLNEILNLVCGIWGIVRFGQEMQLNFEHLNYT